MRKILLKTLVGGAMVFGAVSACAQQDPYYSHFKFVKQAYNPATVGEKDDYICASLLGHNQWLGFDDQTWMDRTTGEPIQGGQITENVAPVTINFNIGGQILGGENRPTPLGAVGLSVFDDRLGYMKTTAFKGQFAYFVPIQGTFARLSIGAEVGFTQFGYVNPNFRFRDASDPRIPTGSISDSRFDAGIGVYYTQSRLGTFAKDFYVGASASHLNGSTYVLQNGNQNSEYQLAQHLYLNTGAKIPLSGGVNVLEPAVLVKYAGKPQFDLNLTVLNNQTIRGGVGYRQWGNTDAFVLLLGYVTGQMQFGYSYDITASRIQGVSNGTHEIFASYCFRLPTSQPPVKTYRKSIREL